MSEYSKHVLSRCQVKRAVQNHFNESNVLVNNFKIAAIEHVDETSKEPVLSSTSVFNKNSDDFSSVEANASVSFLNQSTSVSQETDLPHYNNNDSLSSNSDSNSEGVIVNDIEKLKHWAIEHNITHAALRSLFKILQKFLPNLPRDPRTFLKTTKDVSVLRISGGVFYNFGIKKALEMILKEFNLKDEITFSLQFNIDGLPLHKSTGKQFWPILVRIVSPFKSKISTIGVYYGKSKPSNLEFLNEFIQELKDLLSNGIAFNGKNLGISLFCFSADAPARAFLKCIISHNGYYGCEKCETKGEYVLNRVSFPETDANLRTDSSFRQMLQPEHQNAVSPFVDFVNLVNEFPYDYMHLVCLGVMKRLLLIWINGPQATRLTKACVMNISNRLLEMKECVTTDFSRKPRGLQDIHYWKATEFRLFLLYL